MTKKTLLSTLLLLVFSLSLSATPNDGRPKGQALVREVAVEESSSEYDIKVKLDWTDGSEDSWMFVRHGEFSHRGVDRIYGMVLTALANNKTVYVTYSGDRVTNIYLQRTR